MPPDRASSVPVADELNLVRRAQAGDQGAFTLLYDAYMDRIYRYVYFRVADDGTAEDITSQVFLKAWEKLDSFKTDGPPFVAWLYQVAHNAVIDYYRTRKQTIPIEEAAPMPARGESLDDTMDRQFDLEVLRASLQQLTSEQQQVIVLKFIARLSTEEIARVMKKREGAIRALQMRALQTLAKFLKEEKSQ